MGTKLEEEKLLAIAQVVSDALDEYRKNGGYGLDN